MAATVSSLRNVVVGSLAAIGADPAYDAPPGNYILDYRLDHHRLALRVLGEMHERVDTRSGHAMLAATLTTENPQHGLNFVLTAGHPGPEWQYLDVSESPLVFVPAKSKLVATDTTEMARFLRFAKVLGTIQAVQRPLANIDLAAELHEVLQEIGDQ
jgi:hypothetical protein